MATNFSASQTQGNDEVKEMYCEECEKHEDSYAPADGFCEDCVEYKCADCCRYHRRHFKNHTVKDKDNMPQDFYFEKCSAHPKELIKFFCSECEKSACQECKDKDHQNCNNVTHLPTLVKDIKPSTGTELKDLKENLDKLSNDVKNTEKEMGDKCVIIDSLEGRAKSTVKQHNDQLIENYEQQQKEIIDNFDKKMEETIAKLKKERKNLVEELAEKKSMFKAKISDAEQNIVKTVENLNAEFKTLKKKQLTLVDDLKKLSADLEQAQVLGQNCKLFLTMKLTKRNHEQLSQNMQELQNNYIRCYKVEPNIDLKPSIQSLESRTTFFSYKEIHESAIEKTATFHSDINSESNSFLSLNENTLLAADNCSRSLVIFKITKINIQSYDTVNFEMLSGPWAITKVADNKVAVTFPCERMIRLITFSESMSVVNADDITVRKGYYGIAYSNNNLIVSTMGPVTVQVLDMSGRIVRTIDKDSMGKPLFTQPWYLAISPDHTTIYVSDSSRNTVPSMTFDGKVKAIYKDGQLNGPCQLTVDESGTVYVCGSGSNNVHQLSSDLNKVKILLNESHGMNYPVSVAYCQNNNRLYVGMSPGKIKVFNIRVK
ncbi:E3 ubiquitin-protein ligase TRIM71-like [Mercenaria mercenaria]|uniref:E3 ubiquitin-protein ligase TRIM71-like n=1 Tax=Mercenaria mercenaria TaxID=6596 RepID=UPI00234E9F49|nr:E3 ubiquitin-protein ligase TRIM71-like [Mercenaria mercenaria]